MSIRNKLLLILSAFILIPVLLFGIIFYTQVRDSLRHVRIAQLNDIATLKKEKIENFFDVWRTNIAAAQKNPDIIQYAPVLFGRQGKNDPEGHGHALAGIEEQMRALLVTCGYLSVLLTDARGNVIYVFPMQSRSGAGVPPPPRCSFKRPERASSSVTSIGKAPVTIDSP